MLPRSLSTVARGTAYEEQCRLFCQHQLGMTLMRVGRANDNGVDLRGIWRPSSTSTYNIIAQCKRYSKKIPPSHIRELEGTASTYLRTNNNNENVQAGSGSIVLSILFASAGFTEQSTLRAMGSQTPLLLVTLKAKEEEEGEPEREYKMGKMDFNCTGALSNEAFRKATSGKLQSQWGHSFHKEGSPLFVQFSYDGMNLCSEKEGGKA